jgi:two-component system NarL family sensor kinase
MGEDHRSGVGLSSMRERAEELGGSCVVESAPSGGTRVKAQLPCVNDAADESGLREGT